MKLDLYSLEKWESLNSKLKSDMKIEEPNIHVKIFPNLTQGIFEIAQGTAFFMGFKKSLGFVNGGSPSFSFLQSHFLREMYQIQNLPLSDLFQSEKIQTWVNQLKKDTNFVLLSDDNPITSERFPTEELDQLLNDKKIFSVRVRHAEEFKDFKKPKPYSAHLISVHSQLAVAIFGERYKLNPILTSNMNWEEYQVSSHINWENDFDIQKDSVMEFESSFSNYMFFKKDSLRFYDRSVLVFPDINADALVRKIYDQILLKGHSHIKLNQDINTPNICFHQGLNLDWFKTQNTMGQFNNSEDRGFLRGMIIFSPEIIQVPHFNEIVRHCYNELLSEQQWT